MRNADNENKAATALSDHWGGRNWGGERGQVRERNTTVAHQA